MGKDLHGTELGVGITQRAWGSYSACYTDSNGVRIGRNFKTVDECKAWIERSVIEDKYIGKLRGSAFTVQKWFQYYIDVIKKPVLKESTVELYTQMFKRHVNPIIGRMKLTAVRPLHCQREFDRSIKRIPIRFAKTVFLMKNGYPRRLASYDAYMHRTADKLGIERFSVHALRHTYATRCIEEGMNPKSLQVLLGHSSLEITLNRYVHVTEEESVNEIHSIEDRLDVEGKH